MIKNNGGAIKVLGIISGVVGVLLCMALGIILLVGAAETSRSYYSSSQSGMLIIYGLFFMIIGSFFSVVGAFLIYGFGQHLINSSITAYHAQGGAPQGAPNGGQPAQAYAQPQQAYYAQPQQPYYTNNTQK